MIAYWQCLVAMWLELSPWLFLGLLTAGAIYVFFPAHWIQSWIGGRGLGSVTRAALIGLPIPLCSCGVIPAAITLRKRGASKGATTAFLISTPETGVDSIALTWAMMDPLMTLFRPVAALVTAVFCGWLVDRWPDDQVGIEQNGSLETCHLCLAPALAGHRHSGFEKASHIFSFGFGSLLLDIGKWLVLGVLVAAGISQWLAAGWIEQTIGTGFPSMLIMIAVGIPLYICASASTPIAAALIAQGLSPGAGLVLLLVGPATNVATIGVLWRSLGKRVTFIYLGGLAVLSLGFGLLLDWLYWRLSMTPVYHFSEHNHSESIFLRMVQWSTAVFLLTILAALYIKGLLNRRHSVCQLADGALTDDACCCAAKSTPSPAPNSTEIYHEQHTPRQHIS